MTSHRRCSPGSLRKLVGLSGCLDPLVDWILRFGVLVFWRFGVLAFWCFGVLVFWRLVFWRFGVLAFWCFGVLVFWRFGVLAFWCFGVLAFWRFGVLAFWRFGFGILQTLLPAFFRLILPPWPPPHSIYPSSGYYGFRPYPLRLADPNPTSTPY